MLGYTGLTEDILVSNNIFIITLDDNSTIYSDNFLVFNVLKDDGYYNVRYQFKPLMIWIWLSVVLMSIGGVLSLVKKND